MAKEDWEKNGENQWIKRDEKRHIKEMISIDEGYFSSEPVIEIQRIGGKNKRETFASEEKALEYAKKYMRTH